MAKRKVTVKLWFTAENLDLECYRARVGSGYIVVSMGNVTKLPFKHAQARRRHICRVVADNVDRFFLSHHSPERFKRVLDSQSHSDDQKLRWLRKQAGKPFYTSMQKMRRKFEPASEVIFHQFERACVAQSKLPSAEYSVVPHLLVGLTDKEIAVELGNSAETVAKYVASIRELLGIRRDEGSSRKDRAGLLLALLGN
jgi:DNA-binding NarL/FixJ family response regulator